MLSFKLNFHSDNNDSKTSRHSIDKKDIYGSEERYEFEQIKASLIASYKKKKYRKIFEFLDTKERLYRQSNFFFQLFFSHMKMNCIMKIIDKKFNKYWKSPQIKGIEKWFKFANVLLNKFSHSIFKLNKEEIKEQCEYVLLYYIKINYYHALYSKHKKDNKEYIYYLIMTEQIIKNSINKVTFPQTFLYINRVYLLISNLLIQDNAIFSAINYLLIVLKICKNVKKTEIELKTKKDKSNNNNLFSSNRENETINEDSNFDYLITELYFLTAITFCLLGICFEKLNEYFLANYSYRHAKWITENHLSGDNEFNKLAKLLKELVEKSTKEKNIITILSRIDMVKFISKHKKKPKRKIIDSFDDKKMMKYKMLEKKIDKLKIKDSEQFQQILLTDSNKDESKKSNNIKLMTNNVILLNYLSSVEFKPVIYQIKNMNIYKMNKETEMLINKKLENIKKKYNSSSQVNKSKNSADDSNSNSYFGYKDKLRKIKQKRFQTEMNIKNPNLLNFGKKHLDKINPLKNFEDGDIMKFPSLKSKMSTKNIINRNLIINLFDNVSKNTQRKNSLGIENKNNDFLNESSSFFDNFSLKKNKGNLHQRSFSIRISSEVSENSSFSNELNNLNNLHNFHNLNHSPPHKYKILINSKEIPKINPKKAEEKKIIKENATKKNIKENQEKRKNKVPKPKTNIKKMDKYIFNKAYSKKFEYLDTLTNKEYKFQKSILRNKSFEKIFDEKYEPERIKKDAELFYVKTLDEKLKLLEEKVQNLDNLDKFNFHEKNIEKKLLIYQKKACTTLNYKYKEKYSKLLEDLNQDKEMIKKKNSLMNDNLNFRNNSVGYDLASINENNNIQMNIIGSKIEKIEKKISRSLSQIKNKTKLKENYPKIKKAHKHIINIKQMEIENLFPIKIDKYLNSKNRNSAFINSNLIV